MMNRLLLPSLLIVLWTGVGMAQQLPAKPENISPLLIGEIIPDKSLTGVDGQAVSLHDVFREKPTVLLFYRGGWCPYCNAHLADVGQRESEILALGYQVVAVSPDAVDGLKETAGEIEINYQLLSDADGTLAHAAGLAFQAPDRYGKRLLESSGGKNQGFLPVPAVFVVDTKGTILFEYIDPNYKTRMSGDLLVAVLKALKGDM